MSEKKSGLEQPIVSILDSDDRGHPISAAPTMALRSQPPQMTNQTQQAQSQQPPVAKK
ncbi:MAG: hypothetical protein ORN98_05110 [Alphaproteobacteria bacterium]|nr:hypothetical protein [Alphaproteobacteria bacterium]